MECVDELVPEHMLGLSKSARERHHDAPPQRFGDTTGAFSDHRLDDVGLLEVRVARVEDERLRSAKIVIEELGQASVPALGHARRSLDSRTLLRIVMDAKVRGLEHLELEGVVLHLVAAEVLGVGGDATDEQRSGHTRRPQRPQGCRAHARSEKQEAFRTNPRSTRALGSRMAT